MIDVLETWRHAVRSQLGDAAQLRHQLHQHPRISGDETDTATTVAAAIGCGPGVVVAETGRMITVTEGVSAPVVVRAELDALPVVEQTDLPWSSTNGAMHACGHDVHMAAVVAVARAAHGLDLPAPLRVLLQPREESTRSGARDVVSEGVIDDVRAVIAAHVQPQLPARTVGVTPGAVNAGTCEFTIDVQGLGGHSGYPHTVHDPVLGLAAIVVALQQISARRIDPTVGAVCMVTRLSAGNAANVVPGFATGRGTVRTMSGADEKLAYDAMTEIVTRTAAAYGCTATLVFDSSEPALINDALLATRAARQLAGDGHNVTTEFRSFGSDDFSHFCRFTRGLMIFVGTGPSGGGLHGSAFLPADGYIELVADCLIAGYYAAL